MKRSLLLSALALSALNGHAQTSLHKLIDSVGDWSRLTAYENKLYLSTTMVGGTQYEVDVNTGTSAPVAVFPFTNGQFNYETICRDFVVLNNKVSKVLKHATTGDKYLVVADNSSYDTLISAGQDFFADIKKVGGLVFVTTGDKIYSTDFTIGNTILLDSFNNTSQQFYAGSNYYYYVKRNATNNTIRDIIRTDGITTTILETVNSNNYYIDFIGEQNGEFYYTVALNGTTPTIELKKSTSSIPTTLVNTFTVNGLPTYIMTNSPVTAAGLGKLFIMIKSFTAPYPNDLYCYDITAGTFTKVTDAIANNVTYSGVLNKGAFSDNSFYFYTTGFYRNLWKSDGTQAGTSLYADSVDIRFYDPEYNHSGLSDNGIFCGDYPVAGIDTEPGTATDVEYHFGTSTGFNKYDLNTGSGSYPKDFVKINNILYFLATESNTQFGKQSLYKVDGCGQPTGISNTSSATSGQIEVYPNPSNGTFTISGNNMDKIVMLNMQGQQVQIKVLNGKNTATIEATMLPKGMYLLQVHSQDGNWIRKISIN